MSIDTFPENEPEGTTPPQKSRIVGQRIVRQLKTTETLMETRFSGPLPPPHILAQYEQICPSFAERSLRMVEQQAENRRSLEQAAILANIKHEEAGQRMAFVISLSILGIGALSIALRQNLLGAAFIGADMMALVGMFLYRRTNEVRESHIGVPPQNARAIKNNHEGKP